MPTAIFTVAGMSCGHCAAAVTDEVNKLDGVTDVPVDVDSGTLTVTSVESLLADAVRVAVEEAGYELIR